MRIHIEKWGIGCINAVLQCEPESDNSDIEDEVEVNKKSLARPVGPTGFSSSNTNFNNKNNVHWNFLGNNTEMDQPRKGPQG